MLYTTHDIAAHRIENVYSVNTVTEEMLKHTLNDLKNVGGIEELAVVSRDGLLFCSTVSQKQHAEKFARSEERRVRERV